MKYPIQGISNYDVIVNYEFPSKEPNQIYINYLDKNNPGKVIDESSLSRRIQLLNEIKKDMIDQAWQFYNTEYELGLYNGQLREALQEAEGKFGVNAAKAVLVGGIAILVPLPLLASLAVGTHIVGGINKNGNPLRIDPSVIGDRKKLRALVEKSDTVIKYGYYFNAIHENEFEMRRGEQQLAHYQCRAPREHIDINTIDKFSVADIERRIKDTLPGRTFTWQRNQHVTGQYGDNSGSTRSAR